MSSTLPLGYSGEFDPEELVGTLLDGRYRLMAHVATGGMGAVFQAEHVRLEKRVAIKVLRPELARSREISARFRREARIYASLEHPNIVRIIDFGRTREDVLFLVMEYLEGESLRARLDRSSALGPEDALPILVDIASALAAAHERGIVHRDLKPENIHLARVRGEIVVKVLDFGIAKVAGSSARPLTRHGSVLGTPMYSAPEQAVGFDVDARADVYALGLLAWRILAGRHPFEGREGSQVLYAQAIEPVPSLGEACPELASHPLAAVIAKACSKYADERQRHGAELLSDFQQCRAGWRLEAPAALRSIPAGPNSLARLRMASDRAWEKLIDRARGIWSSDRAISLREQTQCTWTRAVQRSRGIWSSDRAVALRGHTVAAWRRELQRARGLSMRALAQLKELLARHR